MPNSVQIAQLQQMQQRQETTRGLIPMQLSRVGGQTDPAAPARPTGNGHRALVDGVPTTLPSSLASSVSKA